MATERLPMRKIREILRLKWVLRRSHRETARALGISGGAVGSVMARARKKGLDWARVCTLTDEELEIQLYGPKVGPGTQRPLPDPTWIFRELRKPGVTLELLHLEYLEEHADGYRYSAFCEHYRRWLKSHRLSMRQVHRAGDKLFVDYSGKKPHIIDRETGEVTAVELFVAVLGASNLTYAEATHTQRGPEWIQSHIHAFEYFGGVTALVVPDQLRSGVSKPCRYEPGIQRTYEELAQHYGTAVLPARPGKARDKAKVEAAVLVAQRWILACLRHETFFSLAELNHRIWELLERLNNRPMRKYGNESRRELFERIERDALMPLPAERFVFAEWKKARVNIDYHVEVDHHFYSVPYKLAAEPDKEVEVRFTTHTVEIYRRGARVASHRRSYKKGRYTTVPEHMPKSHREHLEWSPSRLIRWASKIGPHAEELVTTILENRPHPEQGYRSCLGLMRLAKRYGDERLDAACGRALKVRARSYRHVASILKNGLDGVPYEESDQKSLPLSHENVRGPDYYH